MSIGVKYIGNRDRHVDNLYGTNLVWEPGQIHAVPKAPAEQMLLHGDVYEAAKAPRGSVAVEVMEESQFKIQPLLPNIEGMTSPELRHYAQQHYGETLHHKMSAENMRLKIVSLIGERGAK